MEKETCPIEIKDLFKQYDKKGPVVMHGISIKICKGEIVGYLGPNGSGKTTTIKMITNMIKPTSGKVLVNGIDAQKYPKKAMKHVGALIEVPGVYDYLTPRELLTYFAKVYSMPKKEIDLRIIEVMSEVKLSAVIDKKIGSFSTGMQRRLMIAKAILHDPDILILDEPVIGLDPKGIKEVRDLIKKQAAKGKTVFLSSHLLSEVSETCDRVIFLNDGKIKEDDTVENINIKATNNTIDVSLLTSVTEKMIQHIGSLQGVTSVTKDNRGVIIYYDGEPQTSHVLLNTLIKTGYKVYSFKPADGGLEDFYLSIMGDEKGVN